MTEKTALEELRQLLAEHPDPLSHKGGIVSLPLLRRVLAEADAEHPPAEPAPAPAEWRTPESVISGLFEETGLGDSLVPVYTTAVLALCDRAAAARLRQAGHHGAAALLEPDPAVIDEAFGPEDQ
ncbi:hypothetical protein KVH27_35095 [Streptomyces olivaceus]|uniref:hypothetical protein n=1 Tax=Streptomyces olivaceus TaxID=47716 RepID=UPI001CCB897F|nr:hypothetical protein [Streptomyces olivaceus]MBZ6253579.1 hypothetical protein [Streptomyces olivaceus]